MRGLLARFFSTGNAAPNEPSDKSSRSREAAMTAAGGAQPAGVVPDGGALISSSKRRGTDSAPLDVSAGKRLRVSPSAEGPRGGTDFARQQDQRQVKHAGADDAGDAPAVAQADGQQQQQAQQQHQQQQAQHSAGESGRARGPLGNLLTPVYYLLQQGSQQFFGGQGAAGQHEEHAENKTGQQQEQPAARAACPASTTSSGAAPASEASESVGGGGGGGGARSPHGGPAADSGCDTDAEVAGGLSAAAAAADAEEEEDEEWFDPLLFISRLPPAAPPGCARPGTLLPRRTRACKQKTLVLDLDETLVHSTLDGAPGSESADFHFPVLFNGAEHMVHVRMRPHMHEFLERAAELFEVVVFTASQKVYAEKLLNILDPQRRLIRHRIYRDSCVFVEGNYLKDLSGLGRDLAHTAIVDNSPQAFGFQVDNGIPIESWYDDEADTELVQLLPLLGQLAEASDVRPLLRERFRMRERVAGALATWRSRMEQEAMAAASWQQQYLSAVQQQQHQQQQHHQQQQQQQQQAAAAAAAAVAQQAVGGFMQQSIPLGQLRAAAAAAAAVQMA
ncbi:CTD small phosphatase [Raphidocelis subcapitata]|uniref:CTD small phosphatase n=1 Tax=Raphidocelis subcapitata TaxID=307507 RepID=A0A2V0PD85_9CHLO|nr:CTD small phosphatase [Raphidocelis subcapitata]|eukprot:GBF96922.1 CTD small phosphatase [Raphidocelis subcapitata]